MRAKMASCGLGGLLLVIVALPDVKSKGTESKPAWQRLLQGEDAKKAAKLQGQINDAIAAKKWVEAVKVATELEAFREAKQGKDHWQAVSDRLRVVALERLRAAPEQQRNAYAANMAVWQQADRMEAKQDYAPALSMRRKLLAYIRDVMGDNHSYTATAYDKLAMNQALRHEFVEASNSLIKVLSIRTAVLGFDHPDTARTYKQLALTQQIQGNYKEAERNYRAALAIHRKVFGEDNFETANSYNSLADNLNYQSRYREAEENLREALAIQRRRDGKDASLTAAICNNLAMSLSMRRSFEEAEKYYREAAKIHIGIYGEKNYGAAIAFQNLAANQDRQGKHAEAEKGLRKALAIVREILGEQYPATAFGYENLGMNLNNQGKFEEAEVQFRKALPIYSSQLGERHALVAAVYKNLALSKEARGKYVEAEKLATDAAAIFEHIRFQAASVGLDRVAFTAEHSPLPLLTALLAHNGKPAAAWERFEESLGRGIGDEFAARLRRPAPERERRAALLVDLRRLEGSLQKLATSKKPTEDEGSQRHRLLTQLREKQDALAKLGRALEDKFGPVEGKVFDMATLQKALPPDASFLGWLDRYGHPKAADPNGDHWAILLKAKGDPVWVRLSGTGAKNAWTKADDELPEKMRRALIRNSGDWDDLARKLRAQRLTPLAKHLEGVKQIVVLPSTQMDGVPVEVIAGDLTVSYSPSASMFAYLKQQARSKNTGLVALGDPNFRYPDQPEFPLPPGGVLLTAVLPGSPAAQSGLRTGDVLLSYGEAKLNSLADLQKALAASKYGARLRVWRLERDSVKAKEMALSVPAGELGVVIARESAPKALADQRKTDKMLVSRDATNWQDLPGTRYEISALAKLFAAEKPTVLFGSEACETRLDELAKAGTLKKARFVHLATHGEARNDKPLASRIILSRDRLKKNQRGELTADDVLRDWRLDAELVTLSACQTGLGAYSTGEGFVGFAHAILLTGSRSACLSRWSVNDLSTALLMERFYENLLGKRGLKAPLGKAAALTEAKQWLRTLPRAEALKRAEAIGVGVSRGPGAKELPRMPVPEGPKDKPPYAHPYYWAGFVLVGDRD